MHDFRDIICVASLEDIVWRFIPLFIISCILFLVKYDSNKAKKRILCCISFILVVFIQAKFGLIHYSYIHETQDFALKHIIWQGTMGVFYAVAYNIIQYYMRNKQKANLIKSHVYALLPTVVIHIITDMFMIISLTR